MTRSKSNPGPSYLQNLDVFQPIHRNQVPTDLRMIGVTNEAIQRGLADLDPTSCIALALTEVLCLRDEIRDMNKQEEL